MNVHHQMEAVNILASTLINPTTASVGRDTLWEQIRVVVKVLFKRTIISRINETRCKANLTALMSAYVYA